jgi:tetratricopeptide (TPR) repeat protein
MHQLIVRHIPDKAEAEFAIVRATDGKAGGNSIVPSPADFPVEGSPGEFLGVGLRWYLEDFLDYPFPPRTDRAERIRAALGVWGRQAFTALFGRGRARVFYGEALRDDPELTIQIESSDPAILAWPWEALEDPDGITLGLTGRVVRRFDATPGSLSVAALPKDRINVLAVIARPYERATGFRSTARTLVEVVEEQRLPAHVEVLRPPTLSRLKEVLAERRGEFHVLHFDGHAASARGPNDDTGAPSPDGAAGQLVFEGDDGGPDLVDAVELAALLREHALPMVFLDACQPGMIRRTPDAFAAAASALVQNGVPYVVATDYSLSTSGARHFLPVFYRALFTQGDVSEAVRAGRKQLIDKPARTCAVGAYDLADWLVPVAYEETGRESGFRFSAEGPAQAEDKVPLPDEAEDSSNPYGLVGRDDLLVALERAMLAEPAGILVTGLGGVGKTTLARGFLKWLAETGGLDFAEWITFSDVRSAESVVNRMVEPIFGADALAAPIEQKLDALALALREQRGVVVWDNFESARGIDGTSVRGLLPADDLAWLKHILEKLSGGKTKILLTSRGDEAWLGAENVSLLALSGLQGDERWEFCGKVLRDLGLSACQKDPDLVDLLEALAGHPLMMRAVLPRLKWTGPRAIALSISQKLAAMAPSGNDLYDRLIATIWFVEEGLSEEVRPLLVPLGLHQRFVDADDLVAMAEKVAGAGTADQVKGLLGALTVAGLLSGRGQNHYELHPTLTEYLWAAGMNDPLRVAWEKAFVDRMARVADHFTPKKLAEQRRIFLFHQANFDHALSLALAEGAPLHVRALTQSLAVYAQKTHSLVEAEMLYRTLATECDEQGELGQEAKACHQLGLIALEQRDIDAAERWYARSIQLNEQLGNEQGAALTYHQLGNVALQRRHFEDAHTWHLRALAINQKLGNEDAGAIAYHQLGSVALEQRDFDAAHDFYLKSLAISEKQGNEQRAASTYHQLGRVAKERDDLEAAESFYMKSISIKETQGNEYDAALTYDRLGILASVRDDFEGAAGWLLRAAQTFSRCQDAGRTGLAIRQFQLLVSRAPADLQPRLQSTWQAAGLPPLPDSA